MVFLGGPLWSLALEGKGLTWESPWEWWVGGGSGFGLEFQKFVEGLVSGDLRHLLSLVSCGSVKETWVLGFPGCLKW